MRRLLLLFFLISVASALEVVPEAAFRVPVGTAVDFKVMVDETSTVTVETDSPELFSWTEKTIYGSVGEARLSFTPEEEGEFTFEVTDGSRKVDVEVTSIDAVSHAQLEERINEMFSRLALLEEQRSSYGGVNTVDIHTKLIGAAQYLEASSEAYNSSRYTEAEIQLGLAEDQLDAAEISLSEAKSRPKDSTLKLDLLVLLGVLVVIIVVAAKYFLF